MNQNIVKEVLYAQQLSPAGLLLVFGVAFILGAIHALGPGHGKSLMAAYLIGSKGRVRDAIILALTLTISHVFSVILIGFIALWVTDFFLPERINQWLGLSSGIIILVIGIWLLITRYKLLKRDTQKNGLHFHDLRGHDLKTASADHQAPHSDKLKEARHSSSPANHQHYQHDPKFSIWSNIALGISGGIIPCPKAIVILLLAISLQRIALGIAIILIFSLGLSFVLVTLGIVMVKAAHLLKGRLEDKRVRIFPIIGAVMIIGLGIFLIIRTMML